MWDLCLRKVVDSAFQELEIMRGYGIAWTLEFGVELLERGILLAAGIIIWLSQPMNYL